MQKWSRDQKPEFRDRVIKQYELIQNFHWFEWSILRIKGK